MGTNYKFWLKEPKGDKATSIIFKFDKGGRRFIYGTGKKVFPQLWDFAAQRPIKDSKKIKAFESVDPQIKIKLNNLKARLSNIISETEKYFALKEMQNEKVDYQELRKYLKKTFSISDKIPKTKHLPDQIYIDDTLLQFVRAIGKGEKNTKSGKRYSLSTLKTIKNLHTLFIDFQDTLKRRVELTEISKELHDQFLSFMNERQYSINTSGKHFANFKVVIRDKLGDIIDKNYENEKNGKEPLLTEKYIQRIERGLTFFTVTEIETTQIALTEEELSKLFHLDLSEKPNYQLARDVFLCGCYTATRYSDYSRFGKEHFTKKIDGNYIQITNQKTKKKVSIPVRPELEAILLKYDFQLPKTYEQKINKYIKIICQMAGIDDPVEVMQSKGSMQTISIKPKHELVKTHTARRTGATLMYQSGEFTHKEIMAITGHKKIESFEKYLRLNSEDMARKMRKGKFFSGQKLKAV